MISQLVLKYYPLVELSEGGGQSWPHPKLAPTPKQSNFRTMVHLFVPHLSLRTFSYMGRSGNLIQTYTRLAVSLCQQSGTHKQT